MKYGDDEFAPFGRRSICFGNSGRTYLVEVDDANQGSISVRVGGEAHSWSIETKSFADKVFLLSGMTAGVGGPHPGDGYWYELVLGKPAILRYWGNQVMAYEDQEVSTPS